MRDVGADGPPAGEPMRRLTVHLGERGRTADGRPLIEVLLDELERRGLLSAVAMRGVEGYGRKHLRQTSRLLTLSEDLPMVTVAIDRESRIEELIAHLGELEGEGLITVSPAATQPPDREDSARLTLFLGRRQRIGDRPGYVAAVELLHRLGVEGATVLLGVDGMLRGQRRQARFLAGNGDVPMLVIAVGGIDSVRAAAGRLAEQIGNPLLTFESTRILKRDGRTVASLPGPEDATGRAPAERRKLTVYCGEQSRHEGRPLYLELVRRVRKAGATGATTLRGVRGYHGEHRPHGDHLFSIRRRAPLITEIVDTTERIARWWLIVDELTEETGLVTVEPVVEIHPGPGVG